MLRQPPSQHTPEGWPAGLKTTKWVYVDYSLLRKREKFTIHIKAEGPKGKHASVSFPDEELERLAHHDNRGTLWIVGLTEVPEAEDTYVYDEHSQWLGEGEPMRGIYKHGAIANTYLNSPLTHVSLIWATLIDLAISLSGLMAVLYLEKLLEVEAGASNAKRIWRKLLWYWGWAVQAIPFFVVTVGVKLTERILSPIIRNLKRHGKPNPAKTVSDQEKQDGSSVPRKADHEKGNAGEGAIRIGISVVVFALAFLISWGMAIGLHWFWFGFVGSAAYALFEPMAAHILHHHE